MNSMSSIYNHNEQYRRTELTARTYIFALATNYASFTIDQNPPPSPCPNIQGADNKLGQFLGQDIEATANHKNVLRHSLESYSSLVSRNVSKPSLVTKICRQSTKLLQLSKELCAPRRDQQGIEKFLKVHRSLVYLLKTVWYQNQDTGEADVTPVQN